MSSEKILQIDLLVPGNADEISIKYPIINKQWIARGNDYYVYVRTNNSTRTDIPAFDDVKGDPWNRSFKDWRYAYAQQVKNLINHTNGLALLTMPTEQIIFIGM